MTTTKASERPSGWRRRIPLVLALLVGTFVWRGGFGFFATERQVTWRLPVAYADVRRVELQVWRGEAVLRRLTQEFPTGISAELTQAVVMRQGEHRAIALVWNRGVETPVVFAQDFDPGGAEAVVLAPVVSKP